VESSLVQLLAQGVLPAVERLVLPAPEVS